MSTARIAKERIARLEALAKEAAEDGKADQSRRYVRLAQRIAERNRLELPETFKHFTCDRCDLYLRPSKNAQVRLHDGRVVMTCSCGEQNRYPYKS